MDELYGGFIFERDLVERLSAVHPMQFAFATTSPGLSTRIGPLKQSFVILENYMGEDPEAEYYEEVG